MSHDASATWSGFNYQGKIALYHSLKLIVEKLRSNNSLNDYELVLENHEDFDIKGPNGFESFHQVKAINQTAFSIYEDALLAMLLQLDSPQYSTVTGYLHTWRPLRWNGNDSFHLKLKGIINKIIVDDIANPGNCNVSKAFTNNVNVNKKVKIIRQARLSDPRMIDVASVVARANQICNLNPPNPVYKRIYLYNYGTEPACQLDQIDLKVKAKIDELLEFRKIPVSDIGTDKIFCCLLGKLDRNIIEKHQNLNTGQLTPIAFSDILNIVENENLRDGDEAFLAGQFKLHFVRSFEEFLDDDELCSGAEAKAYYEGDSNLNTVMEVLLQLSAIELWDYFKKLNPQISFDTNSVIDQAFTTNLDNLRNYLFLIFTQLCKTKLSHVTQHSQLTYRVGAKSYLPTTIGNNTKKQVVIGIMQNSNAIMTLFEVNALVTGDDRTTLQINDFLDVHNKVSDVNLDNYYEDESVEDKEKISQISRRIRLINIQQATLELNDA
ncbi:ABC-three component system protein [Colwellia sp. TT2012]|uniref:ABC-three component system protein n=1 Tax=Colwellia sp. TT2012 TaxID=1720342 RepID=UPI00070D010D|nr:ABC-three component system protein [Colwellia sp. TT2012]